MPKKLERPFDTSSSIVSRDAVTLSTCFEQEFYTQCSKAGIISIPQIKTGPLNICELSNKHRKSPNVYESKKIIQHYSRSSKHQASHKQSRETSIYDVDSRSKNLTTGDSAYHFIPRIEVYETIYENSHSIVQASIKGWKIESNIFDVFKTTHELMRNLHTLHFWRAGLTSKMMIEIGTFIASSQTIKILKVEGNQRIYPENYHELLQPKTCLVYLSIRFCKISSIGIQALACRLGNHDPETSLISLDLTGNGINDEGTCFLAQALRTNRSLKALSLSMNSIGDVGVLAFCEVLTKFYLKSDELYERRKLKFENILKIFLKDSSTEILTSVDYNKANLDKNKESKMTNGKKGDKSMQKKQQLSPRKGKELGKQTPRNKGGRGIQSLKTPPKTKDLEEEENNEMQNPLLTTPGEFNKPYGFRIIGNYILNFLNLSYNHITLKGVMSIRRAIEYQLTRIREFPSLKNIGLTGLLLSQNLFDRNNSELENISEILNQKVTLFSENRDALLHVC